MSRMIVSAAASVVADAGKVRLGALAPALPAAIADAGKVRLGALAPALPASRA
jgi:hypothetical protein